MSIYVIVFRHSNAAIRGIDMEKRMEYMILIYGDEKAFDALPESARLDVLEQYRLYTEQLEAAGVMRGGSQLASPDTARTVRVRDGKSLLTDGPYAETKEQLGGYYIIETAGLEQALHWASLCPTAAVGSVEVRQMLR